MQRSTMFLTRRAQNLIAIRQGSTSVKAPARLSSIRTYATNGNVGVQPPDYLDAGEKRVFSLLKDGLSPTKLEVQDISGGCGSTYALDIVSEQFAGIPLLKQHRLVKKVLEEEMKNWHGIQLKTKAP